MNIMMSQQNPILLSKMVSKYCKILKEKYSNVNCKWLFYWQDLERFSLLWTFDSIDGTESTEKSVVFDQRGGRLEVLSVFMCKNNLMFSDCFANEYAAHVSFY